MCVNCSSVLETGIVANIVLPSMKQENAMELYKDRLSKDWLQQVRNRVTSKKVVGIGHLGIGDATIWNADPAEQAKDGVEAMSASVLSKHNEKNKGVDKKVLDFIKRRKKTRKAEPYGIEDRFFSFLNFDEKVESDFFGEMYRLKANFDAAEEHLKTLNMRQSQIVAAPVPSKNSKRAPKILLSATDEIQ